MKLRGDLILRQMGNEYVIVDPSQDVVDMSRVFTLNDTAAFIWKELDGADFNVESITNLLVGEFEVNYEQAQLDAELLFNQFEKEGLLEE